MRIRVTLRRVRLNRNGYAARGHYWGVGAPLWYFSYLDPHSNLEHTDHLRAPDRATAKDMVRATRAVLRDAVIPN